MAKEYKGTVQKLLGLIGILLPIFIDLILFLNIQNLNRVLKVKLYKNVQRRITLLSLPATRYLPSLEVTNFINFYLSILCFCL